MNDIDVDFIKTVAIEAGKKIISVYESDHFETEFKSDTTPLTLADRVANTYILDHLTQKYPDIPFISEETKHTPYNERKDWELFWLIDPLDGTKEFVKKNGEFTVNIALIEKNRPILGVIYVPVSKTIYWGKKGEGSYQEKNGTIEKLSCASFRLAQQQLTIVCSKSHIDEATQKFMDTFSLSQQQSIGSSLKFLLLAEGKAHVYPRFAPTMEWDIAAADIILCEAHGKVLDYQQQIPMVYNKEILRNPSFVAYGNVVE